MTLANPATGTSWAITVPTLVGTETVTSWVGTVSEPVISAGLITLDEGYLAELVLSDGTTYYVEKVAENPDTGELVLKDAVGGNDSTSTTGDKRWFQALTDGTDDVAGLGIRNPAAPDRFINCGTSLKWVAGNPDDAEALLSAFYSEDGINFDAKSFGDYLFHLSGNDGLWIKWGKEKNACHVEETGFYPTTKVWTLDKWEKNERYFVQGVCGSGHAPFSNLDFSNPENSHWLGVM